MDESQGSASGLAKRHCKRLGVGGIISCWVWLTIDHACVCASEVPLVIFGRGLMVQTLSFCGHSSATHFADAADVSLCRAPNFTRLYSEIAWIAPRILGFAMAVSGSDVQSPQTPTACWVDIGPAARGLIDAGAFQAAVFPHQS